MEERGWMPGVEHQPSEAFGYSDMPRGSMRAIAVMSHIMQGYQRTMIAWARERPYATPKSAHFTIGRGGRIVQHVGVYDPAWTAGHVNRPTWPRYRPSTNPNRYLVHIEHEGFSVPPGYGYDYVYDDRRPWPALMVDASVRVQRWVLAELAIEASQETVIGHFETDSVNRVNDPGPAWPPDEILEALTPATGPRPGDPFVFEARDLAWPDGDAAQLVQAALAGRARGHRYVEWRGRVVPSVVILPP
jgi:N-acetyl-anhydromuramyl-L-alanine amidase AmpD